MDAHKLRAQLRTAGYAAHARNLPAWLALHPPLCTRKVGRVTITFARRNGVVTVYEGERLICDETQVYNERRRLSRRHHQGAPAIGEQPMRVYSLRIGDDLLDRIGATRPGEPVGRTIRAILRAHLKARGRA